MATRAHRVAAGQDGNFGALTEADVTAANRTDGWTSAKIAAGNSSEFDAATKKASGTFNSQTTTPKPATLLIGTNANAFKCAGIEYGTYANGTWTFTFALRCTTASSQRGRMLMRVFKANASDGSGATELTTGVLVGTTVAAALSTSADQTSVVTWNPGTAIVLDGEYLFFLLAWEITTAGGSNSADVVIRTGQSAGGSRLVTPDWVGASAPIPDYTTSIDNFDRADDLLNVGAGADIWNLTYYNSTDPSDLRIISNRLGSTVASWRSAWTKGAVEDSCDILIDCATAPTSPLEFGLFFCITDPGTAGFDGYAVFWIAGNYILRRYANGSPTTLATVAGSLSAGDTLWIRKRGSDIRLYRGPSGLYSRIFSVTDSTYTAGGNVAVEISDTTQRWDNLRGGPYALPVLFPTANLLDNFDRADGALGASWTTPAFGQSSLVVRNNKLDVSSYGISGGAAWAAGTYADGEIYATVPAWATEGFSLIFRASQTGSAYNGYCLRAEIFNTILYPVNGGVFGTAILTIPGPLASGDAIGVKFVGTKIEAFKKLSGGNWAKISEVTDSQYTAAGYLGAVIPYKRADTTIAQMLSTTQAARYAWAGSSQMGIGQQFIPSQAGTINKLTLRYYWSTTQPTDQYKVSIRTDNGADKPSGTILGTAYITPAPGAGGTPTLIELAFSVPVNAGQKYWITVHRTNTPSAVGSLYLSGSSTGTGASYAPVVRETVFGPEDWDSSLRDWDLYHDIKIEVGVVGAVLDDLGGGEVQVPPESKGGTDSGVGSETSDNEVAQYLQTEAGVGSDVGSAIIVPILVQSVESGAGDDTSVLTFVALRTETGAGTETSDNEIATVAGNETGAGADVGLAIPAVILVQASEIGAGSDVGTLQSAPSGVDTGDGQDLGSLAVTHSRVDAGAGTEQSAEFAQPLGSDGSAGAEASSLLALTSALDTGTSIEIGDVPIKLAVIAGTDTATVSEVGSGVAVALASDVGSGLDTSLLSYTPTLTDAGSGVEVGVVTISALVKVGTDSGAGSEIGTVPSATIPAVEAGTGSEAGLALLGNILASDIGSIADSSSIKYRIFAAVPSDNGSGDETAALAALVAPVEIGAGDDVALVTLTELIVFGTDSGTSTESGSYTPTAGPWDPSHIAGLGIWFDASQLGLADGSDVSPWPNLINSLLPGSIVGTPTPKVRANALKEKPVVRFKSGEGGVRITGTGVHLSWTIVYVGRMVGPQPGRVVTAIYPEGGNLLIGYWNGFQDRAYDNGFTMPEVYTDWTTDWKMYAGDGNPTIPRTRFFGGPGPTLGLFGTTATGQGWGNTFAISGYAIDTATESSDCEVAEVVVYNRQLGGLERQQLETYLYEKWLVTTTLISGTDSGSGDDVGLVANKTLVGTDSGVGSDAGTVLFANPIGADSGAGSEVGSSTARPGGIEAGAGTDSGVVPSASLFVSEAFTAVEVGSPAYLAARTETGVGNDVRTLLVLAPGQDIGVGIEAGVVPKSTLYVGEILEGSEAGLVVEAAIADFDYGQCDDLGLGGPRIADILPTMPGGRLQTVISGKIALAGVGARGDQGNEATTGKILRTPGKVSKSKVGVAKSGGQ